MQMNQLVLQVKYRMENIEDAENTGDEEKVRASVEELRDFLNLAHADAKYNRDVISMGPLQRKLTLTLKKITAAIDLR